MRKAELSIDFLGKTTLLPKQQVKTNQLIVKCNKIVGKTKNTWYYCLIFGGPMKASERIGSIISQIPYNGFIMVKDLSRMFSVTEETIRRDLGRIVDMNIGICKVH